MRSCVFEYGSPMSMVVFGFVYAQCIVGYDDDDDDDDSADVECEEGKAN